MYVPGIPKNYDEIKISECNNPIEAFEILKNNFSYTNINYFSNLLENIKNGQVNDDIIREYVIFSKMNRLTFSINRPLDENIFDNLWAKKIIDINFNGFSNIIMQYLCVKHKIISKKILEEYYSILKENKYQKYKLYVYLHKTQNINLNYTTNDFFSTYILTSCMFHDKSLKIYELFMFNPLLSKSKMCYIHLNTFLKYMIDNFNIMNMKRYIIFSGGILSLTGLRYCGDIDIIFSLSNKEKNIQHKIENIQNKNSEIGIANITKPLNYFKLEKDGFQSYERWAKMSGAEGIDDMILNSKYHWYFMGVKLTNLEFEVRKKIERPFPKSILDLILFKLYFKYNFELPEIDISFFKRINEGNFKRYGKKQLKYLKNNRINYCIYFNVFKNYMNRILTKRTLKDKHIIINILKSYYKEIEQCK